LVVFTKQFWQITWFLIEDLYFLTSLLSKQH